MPEKPERIREAAFEAGIVGAGGAGFPTHVKLEARADTLIINGAECEPLLETDLYLLKSFGDEVLEGAKLASIALGAKRVVLAARVEDEAMRGHLEALCKRHKVEFFELENVYPAGDEVVLTYTVTGRVVPEAGIPPQVGVVVHNVETLLNLARAVREGRPVTRTWVTVAGAVGRRVVVEAPVGMAVSELVEAAGGPTEAEVAALDGGPMTGNLLPSLDEPVLKTTKGLTILPEGHPLIVKRKVPLTWTLRQARSACTQCIECTLACPRRLLGHAIEPHKVMRAVSFGVTAGLEAATCALLCPECGLCEFYVCPQRLLPRRVISEVKAEFQRRGVRYPKTDREIRPDPFFEARRIPRQRLSMRIGVWRYEREPAVFVKAKPPRVVRLRLKQHVGAPARPKVKEGDEVKEGEVVAEPLPGDLGAKVHASISGRVVKVDQTEIVLEAG